MKGGKWGRRKGRKSWFSFADSLNTRNTIWTPDFLSHFLFTDLTCVNLFGSWILKIYVETCNLRLTIPSRTIHSRILFKVPSPFLFLFPGVILLYRPIVSKYPESSYVQRRMKNSRDDGRERERRIAKLKRSRVLKYITQWSRLCKTINRLTAWSIRQ
jgi:hypothetical protein